LSEPAISMQNKLSLPCKNHFYKFF